MPSLAFDPVVTNPGRLTILAALSRDAGGVGQDFMQLRRATQLTDGNLATHARRLQSAGLVTIEKNLRDEGARARTVTTFHLTPRGRDALRTHVVQLTNLFTSPEPPAVEEQRRVAVESIEIDSNDDGDEAEEWID